MLPTPKNSAYTKYPFGSYQKPQISDLVVLAAYPFGSILSSVSKGEYRHGFNGQEKVDEISGSGNHNTAEHWEYDTRLGRRWNLDPVIKSWQSGYACFSNNPIVMIDPNGDADFYNQRGRKVGTNGVDDGKLYVLTNQADVKRAQQSYFGKGIKGFIAILTGNGGKGTIQMSEFKGDVVALPSANVRARIGAAVDRSNSPTTDDTKGGFHEEGGIFGTNASGAETVVDAKPGSYSNPKTDSKATVDVFDAANPAEAGTITNVQGTYHIHPAGKIVESPVSSTPGTATTGGTTTTYSFEQTPSNKDVSIATQGGNSSGYNIVVGAGNNTVYIHGSSGQNQSGTTYRASFPLDKFKSIDNEKKTP
jgi:RHS repeat-associated protein